MPYPMSSNGVFRCPTCHAAGYTYNQFAVTTSFEVECTDCGTSVANIKDQFKQARNKVKQLRAESKS